MISKLVTLQRMGWSSFHVSCCLATLQLRGVSTSSHLLGNLSTKNVEQSPTKRMLDILGQDDSSRRYPYVYLCPCSDCYFRDSSQHLLDTVREVDLSIIPDKVEINNDGTELSITWPNGHVSLFDCDWLFEKRLLDESKPPAKDNTKVATRDLGRVVQSPIKLTQG